MFSYLFWTLLRTLGVPIVAILALSSTMLGQQMAFLAVAIVNTVIHIPLVLWHLIKIFPNLALIRTKSVLKLVVEIIIEVLSVAGFWFVYLYLYMGK